MSSNKTPGRPKGSTLQPSNLYVPLPVRIPQYLLDRLDQLSQKKQQTRSQTVIDAISEYLTRNQ